MEEKDKLPVESEGQTEPVAPTPEISEPSESLPDMKEETTTAVPPELDSPEVFVPEGALAPKKSRGERFMGLCAE